MAKTRSGSNFVSIGVAVLALGVFFGWLATREPPRAVAVAEPGNDTAATIDESQARTLDEDGMARSALLDALRGEAVRMNNVTVAARLGPQMFWALLPAGEVYLVKLGDELVAGGMQPPSSGSYDLVGRILTKDAARLDEWMRSGALETEDQRMQAEFGETYLEARRVQPVAN